MSTAFGKRGLDVGPSRGLTQFTPEERKAKQLRLARMVCVPLIVLSLALVVLVFLFSPTRPVATATTDEQSLPVRDDWTVVSTERVAFKRSGEPQATYAVIGVAKTSDGKAVAMNTRYSDVSGTDYTMRVYDCEAGKLFTVGSGTTFEAMQVYRPDPRWGELVKGSSASSVASIACSKIGKQLATF